MSTTWVLSFIVFIFVWSNAYADQFYLTVGMRCNQNQHVLVINFDGAWNEKGEKKIASLDENIIDPRKLVSFEQSNDGKYSSRKTSETRVCLIGRNRYVITVSPQLAHGFQPEGFCATRIGANVAISLDGKLIASSEIDACTEIGKIVKSITIKPNKPVSYSRVSAASFYEN